MEPVILSDEISADGMRHIQVQTSEKVCSVLIDIDLEGDIVRRVQYTKGCHGNTQGVAALCAGMKASDVIARLEGINCHARGTSCPDQLAPALKAITKE